ncbi:MAG: NAD(P)-dependent oxidoreductase [Bacteroidales bacterium]
MKIVFAEPIGLTEDDRARFSEEMSTKGHSVTYFDDVPKDDNDLIIRVYDADVVVVSNCPVSSTAIKSAKKLKYISVAFTGIDHIAQSACKENDIVISNAAGYSTQAVAELTIGMAIDMLRNVTPADAVTRSLGGRSGFLGRELFGKTFGVLGTGAIGLRVSQLANAFGCDVIAWSRTVKSIDGVKYMEFDQVIEQSDILSVHLPLTQRTEGLIGEREFEMMKDSAILINTARGKIVETEALVKALNKPQIAGAAIDMYEKEPPLDATHPLLTAQNTLLLPHLGFATHEAIAQRSVIVLDNIGAWLNGDPRNVVG